VGRFYKAIAEEGVSCLGLAETWAVFRYAWGCVLQFANRTEIVWEMSIKLSRIHENCQFPNSCKEDDFLRDV